MADNIDVTPGVGKTIAADEISSALHQRVKVTLGADGVNDGDVSSSNPMPVSGPLTDTQLRASAVPVSSASLPLPTGAATAANQATEIASLASIDGKITTVNTGAVVVSSSALPAGASTSAKQPALGTAGTASADVITVQGIASMTPIAVSSASLPLPTGAATAANQSTEIASLASIDTKLTSPLTVTGPLTDTQLRASAVPVSGTVTANLGTIAGVSTAANQTNGSQLAQIVDPGGVNKATVNANGSLTVAGVSAVGVAPANPPVSVSGVDGGGLKRHVLTDTSGRIEINTAQSLPLPALAATSTKQSDGTQKTQIVDGAGSVIGNAVTLSGVNYLPVVLAASSTSGAAIPSRAVMVAGSDGTNAQNIKTDTSGRVAVTAPVNTTGSGSGAGATVSTVQTLTAPANAVGFILMNLDISTTNMRWAVGRTSSTTLGQQLQPGRDTGFVPVGANISIIAESGTSTYDVQWISQ